MRKRKTKIQRALKDIKISSFCDLFPIDIVKYIFSILNSKSIKVIRLTDKRDNEIVTQFVWFSISNISEKNIDILYRFISRPIKPKIRTLIVIIPNQTLSSVRKILTFYNLYVLKLILDFHNLYCPIENTIYTIFDIKIRAKNIIIKDYHTIRKSLVILPNCVQGLYLSDISKGLNLKIPFKAAIKELYLKDGFYGDYFFPEALFSISSLNKICFNLYTKSCSKLISSNVQLKELKYLSNGWENIENLIYSLKPLCNFQTLVILLNYYGRSNTMDIDCELLPTTLQCLYIPFGNLKGDITRFTNLNKVCCHSINGEKILDRLAVPEKKNQIRFICGSIFNRKNIKSFFPNSF